MFGFSILGVKLFFCPSVVGSEVKQDVVLGTNLLALKPGIPQKYFLFFFIEGVVSFFHFSNSMHIMEALLGEPH